MLPRETKFFLYKLTITNTVALKEAHKRNSRRHGLPVLRRKYHQILQSPVPICIMLEGLYDI